MCERMPTFSATALQRLAESMLEAVGTPSDLAQVVAESLLAGNLAGHDSHGVQRIVSYVRFVGSGRVAPAARARVVAHHQATATVDGQWG
jgi:LDH2 family malate/lactate/ureidoglycolate dehydrogenase